MSLGKDTNCPAAGNTEYVSRPHCTVYTVY